MAICAARRESSMCCWHCCAGALMLCAANGPARTHRLATLRCTFMVHEWWSLTNAAAPPQLPYLNALMVL